MTSRDMDFVARKLIALEQSMKKSRATQLPSSSVRLIDGDDVDVVQGVESARDAAEDTLIITDNLNDVSDIGDNEADYSTEIPEWIQEGANAGDVAWDNSQFATDLVLELETELEDARDLIDTTKVELEERLGMAETDLSAATDRINFAEDRLDSTTLIAQEALDLAPLTTEELTAITALVDEAFVRSGHIIDLDVGKLKVTETSIMNEAVVNTLFAEIVSSKVVEITDKLIGTDGTFTGKLTADHLNVETLFGTRIDGLQIHGGSFVQYATGNFLPIYPSPASWVEVSDWVGGPPEALVGAVEDTGVKETGAHSARMTRSNSGSISAQWENNGHVPVRSGDVRRVSIRFKATKALTNAHIIVGQSEYTLGDVPADTWTTISVDIPEGATLEWAHFGADSTSQVNLYVDTLAVLSATLVGAHMRIDRDAAGIPGLYGYNASSEKLVSVTPTEVKTVVPVTGEYVRMTGKDIEFSPGGTLVGENIFPDKTTLLLWEPLNGTHAWVESESKEYVRINNEWLPITGPQNDGEWSSGNVSSPFMMYSAGSTITARKSGAFTTVSGVVTLNNSSSHITGNTERNFITLPTNFRPKDQLFQVCQGSSTDKWLLVIRTDGTMSASRYDRNFSGYNPWLNFTATYYSG